MGNIKSKPKFHRQSSEPLDAPIYPPYAPGASAPYMYTSGYRGPGFIPPTYQMQMPVPQIPSIIPETQRKKEKKKKRPTTAPQPLRMKSAAANAQAQAHAHAQARAHAQEQALEDTLPPGFIPTRITPHPPNMHIDADALPPGFVPTHVTPNPQNHQVHAPVIPPLPQNFNNTATNPPPLFTPGATSAVPLTSFDSQNNQAASGYPRRASTPFVRQQHHDDDDEEEEQEQEQVHHAAAPAHNRTQSRSHRRQHSSSRPRRHTLPRLPAVDPAPLLPQNPPNPLPEPPRDLYSFSPYKNLLTLPNTTALFSATTTNEPINPNVTVVRSDTNPGIAGIGAGMNPTQKTKTRRGLFRFGSKRQPNVEPQQPQPQPQPRPQPHIQFIAVPVYQDRPGLSSTAPPTQPTADPTLAAPSTTPVYDSPRRSPSPDLQRSNTPHSHHQPQPRQSPAPSHSRSQSQPNSQPHHSTQPIFPFDQYTQPGFLNHSPHRVMFGNQTYPTATHLNEAFKYIDQRPDLAERIRRCPTVQEVYPLSASFQSFVRPDWLLVFVDKMEEVLWYKFRQHKVLRQNLLATGNSELVYAVAEDVFWGCGRNVDEVIREEEAGPGENKLGILLMKIRDRLRREGSD